jgi:hypothetical protein
LTHKKCEVSAFALTPSNAMKTRKIAIINIVKILCQKNALEKKATLSSVRAKRTQMSMSIPPAAVVMTKCQKNSSHADNLHNDT